MADIKLDIQCGCALGCPKEYGCCESCFDANGGHCCCCLGELVYPIGAPYPMTQAQHDDYHSPMNVAHRNIMSRLANDMMRSILNGPSLLTGLVAFTGLSHGHGDE